MPKVLDTTHPSSPIPRSCTARAPLVTTRADATFHARPGTFGPTGRRWVAAALAPRLMDDVLRIDDLIEGDGA
jgi:hypothetical protein